MTEPFHPGEIALQLQTGERDKAVLNGRLISAVIPKLARSFLNQQTYAAIGWTDAEHNLWATLLIGSHGFALCDEEGAHVRIRLPHPAQDLNALRAQLRGRDAVGMLFIDLATRRRLRVNGLVDRIDADCLYVLVKEAYPNCPKYIQRRHLMASPTTDSNKLVRLFGSGVPPDLEAWLSLTDTAFVATADPGGSIDCSHRGGSRGFIRLHYDELLVPDYAGNSMFCTLGNISVYPRAGLTLIDFNNSRQLKLSGEARLCPSMPISPDLTGGTGRGWSLKSRKWEISPLTSGEWQWIDASPFNP